MGRGRAKAKQQKVARDLKYNTRHTDLDALQRELGGSHSTSSGTADYDDNSGEDNDAADWARSGR